MSSLLLRFYSWAIKRFPSNVTITVAFTGLGLSVFYMRQTYFTAHFRTFRGQLGRLLACVGIFLNA